LAQRASAAWRPLQLLFRWWPVLGLLAMAGLARVVGTGSTRVDRYFLRDNTAIYDWRLVLLFVSDARVVTVAWAVGVGIALWQQRTRLALVALVTVPVTTLLVPACKQLFGRTKGGTWAYPSGHTTVLVVVLGMLVLLAAWKTWAVIAAGVLTVWGMLGQSLTYHYFTDTVGGLLLGSAIVAAAAVLAGCPPPGCRPLAGS